MKNFEFNDLPFGSSVKNIRYSTNDSTLAVVFKGNPTLEYTYGGVTDIIAEEIKRIIVNEYIKYVWINNQVDKPSLVLKLPIVGIEPKIIELDVEFGWILDKLTSLSGLSLGQYIGANIKPVCPVISKQPID